MDKKWQQDDYLEELGLLIGNTWTLLPMWLKIWRCAYYVCLRRLARPRVSKWWLGFKTLLKHYSNLYYRHAKAPKHREMQSHDALQPFFGLIVSTVERSQFEKRIQSRENPCAALSRKIGSHLHAPKAAPPEPKNWKVRKRPVNGCSLDIGTCKIYMGPGKM